VSNSRRLKPREPDETEAAFRDELRKGCQHCGSTIVVARFRGIWDYGLRCNEGCPTLTDQALAHRVAAQAAERAGMGYRAVDSCSGQVTGVVVARAGAGA
jgi:hypothetical protein